MSSTRYLMYMSYIGKPFWGAQRQVKRTFPPLDDPKTVQGRLEMGLKMLNTSIYPTVVLSSRTDAGVHAFNATCHVDLHREGEAICPGTVGVILNKYFRRKRIPIHITQSYIVPETFHCRHNAVSRTYLYRLLVKKNNDQFVSDECLSFFPIEELDRCQFISTHNFDLELMEEASKMFVGYHDFRTFMNKQLNGSEKITRKHIDNVTICRKQLPGYSSYSWPSVLKCEDEQYLPIDIYIKGSSFLYRQVRRTVAALVGVAQGKITLNDIKLMLEIPSSHSWCDQLKVVSAHGLYLCEVSYSKEDLETFRSTTAA